MVRDHHLGVASHVFARRALQREFGRPNLVEVALRGGSDEKLVDRVAKGLCADEPVSADLLRIRMRVEGDVGFLNPADFEAHGGHPLWTRQDTLTSWDTDLDWLVRRVLTRSVTAAVR